MKCDKGLKRAISLLGPKATVTKGVCVHYEKLKKDEVPLCTGCSVHAFPCPGGLPLFSVGKIAMGMFHEIMGEGNTLKEALENAKKRMA